MRIDLIRISTFFLTLIPITACSTIDPYIELPDERPGIRQPADGSGSPRNAAGGGYASVTVPEVRHYARALHDAYIAAVANQESFNNAAQLSLIPLAATATGLGISGGSGDAITILGLSGAGLVTAGTVAVNEERQRIYLAAARAMTCIQRLANDFEAALPFAPVFEENGDAKMETLRTALLALQRAQPGIASSSDQLRAETALSDGERTLAAAASLRRLLRIPEQILLYRVDEVQNVVHQLIQGTSVDLTTFASTLSGRLGAIQHQIVQIPERVPAVRGAVADDRVEQDTINRLIDNVVIANADLANLIASSGINLEIADRSCATDFPNATNPLAVSPSPSVGISGAASGAFTANILVSGGVPPYGIIPSAGVTVTERIPMGRSRERFDLAFTDGASFDPILIYDANDQQLPIEIPVARAN